jgi:hypothetical protein
LTTFSFRTADRRQYCYSSIDSVSKRPVSIDTQCFPKLVSTIVQQRSKLQSLPSFIFCILEARTLIQVGGPVTLPCSSKNASTTSFKSDRTLGLFQSLSSVAGHQSVLVL